MPAGWVRTWEHAQALPQFTSCKRQPGSPAVCTRQPAGAKHPGKGVDHLGQISPPQAPVAQAHSHVGNKSVADRLPARVASASWPAVACAGVPAMHAGVVAALKRAVDLKVTALAATGMGKAAFKQVAGEAVRARDVRAMRRQARCITCGCWVTRPGTRISSRSTSRGR
jgi:hypothetical protein